MIDSSEDLDRRIADAEATCAGVPILPPVVVPSCDSLPQSPVGVTATGTGCRLKFEWD
jgi:hypothetical protein